MAHYSTTAYWERRYATHRGSTFDWYIGYGGEGAGAVLREELNSVIRRGSRILVVGCGTSCLAEGLYDDGYTNLVALDFSPSAVEAMAERSGVIPTHANKDVPSKNEQPPPALKARPGLVYMVANATELASIFTENSFDVVFDKAMIDACFCGESDAAQRKHVAQVISGIGYILKKGGKLFHVTHTDKTSGIRSMLFDDTLVPWANVQMTKLVTTVGPGVQPPPAATKVGDDRPDVPAAPVESEFLTRTHFMYTMTK